MSNTNCVVVLNEISKKTKFIKQNMRRSHSGSTESSSCSDSPAVIADPDGQSTRSNAKRVGSLQPHQGDERLQKEAERLGAASVHFLVCKIGEWSTAWNREGPLRWDALEESEQDETAPRHCATGTQRNESAPCSSCREEKEGQHAKDKNVTRRQSSSGRQSSFYCRDKSWAPQFFATSASDHVVSSRFDTVQQKWKTKGSLADSQACDGSKVEPQGRERR